MSINIDEEFRSLIPPLSQEERQQLESNLIADGCRDPLVVWEGTLIDGHNRFEICNRLSIPFETTNKEFASRNDVVIWIIQNQFGRRNLPDYERSKLALRLKPLIASKAKEQQGARNDICQKSDKSIDTKKELATLAGVSHDTIAKVEKIEATAVPELKQAITEGKASINTASKIATLPKEEQRQVASMTEKEILAKAKEIQSVKREKKREEVIAKLENIEVKEAKAMQGVYDVIVLDPPWQMEKIERDVTPEQVNFDYPTMTESELEQMILPMADDCHVWQWTTHKHFPLALRLFEAWGVKYVCTFVWHKNGGFQPFGLPQFNCEFCLYGRHGTPQFIDLKQFFTCFDADRGAHSEKPEAFYSMVRRVTAGRRIDMFNRRKIEGFDGWGKEAV